MKAQFVKDTLGTPKLCFYSVKSTTPQDLADILYGGAWWADSTPIVKKDGTLENLSKDFEQYFGWREHLVTGGEIEFLSDGDEKVTCNTEQLMNGVAMAIDHMGWDRVIENSDVVSSGVVLQFAIFNEIVYG